MKVQRRRQQEAEICVELLAWCVAESCVHAKMRSNRVSKFHQIKPYDNADQAKLHTTSVAGTHTSQPSLAPLML